MKDNMLPEEAIELSKALCTDGIHEAEGGCCPVRDAELNAMLGRPMQSSWVVADEIIDNEQPEPVKPLSEFIHEYVDRLEITLTLESCKCAWTDLGKGRRVHGEASLECPVHTKEGLILGFFQWMQATHNAVSLVESGTIGDHCLYCNGRDISRAEYDHTPDCTAR